MRYAMLAFCGLLVLAAWSAGQEVRGPVKVTIKDGRAIGEATLPIDPNPRIQPQFGGTNGFGLTLDKKQITDPGDGIWGVLMVDGNIGDPFADFGRLGRVVQRQPLPPTASGRKRLGTQWTWKHRSVQVTQAIEIVPSRCTKEEAGKSKVRLLDTCRMTYILENTDKAPHKVAFKTNIVFSPPTALCASPTMQPGKILDGVILKGKDLPEYLLVLGQPDLANPGLVATVTLNHGKGENPDKVVLTNLGVGTAFQGWAVPAVPAARDSMGVVFWPEKELKPCEKRELVWGYGGGMSTSAENEGRVSLGLSGSFEPGKLFTIVGQVEDPLPNQALALELPAGLERVEGRAIQPVASAPEHDSSMVMWKARVVRPGDYEIRVRSSTGSVQSKHVRIEAAAR